MAVRVFGVLVCLVTRLFAADVSENTILDLITTLEKTEECSREVPKEQFINLNKSLEHLLEDEALDEVLERYMAGQCSTVEMTNTIFNGDESKESSENQTLNDIIRLKVGGKRFATGRGTLCRYPNSPLARTINQNSGMQPRSSIEYRYFLDEDPKLFRHFLNFLRDGTLPNLSENERAILSRMFNQWLGMPLPICQKTKKKCQLVAQFKTAPDGRLNWFLFDKKQKEIIGNNYYGFSFKNQVIAFIKEYQNRPVHRDFIYTSSGNGFAVYSLKTNRLIGERVLDFRNHEVLNDSVDNFLNLHLIENIVSVNERKYLCTFNREGDFSAFNAKTYKKILKGQRFTTHEECIKRLRERFAPQISTQNSGRFYNG